MSTALVPPPRTPSPRVRIRAASFSFDSPPSRSGTTPLEEPFSKSTGAITTSLLARHHGLARPAPPLLRPLHTKMSDESMSDASSASASSGASSPTAGADVDVDAADEPVRRPARARALALAHVDAALPAGNLLGLFTTPSPMPSPSLSLRSDNSISSSSSSSSNSPPASPAAADPFAFQDPAFPMYPPFLVRVVLDLYDVRGLAWQNIAEPVERIWGVRTSSAEVLEILSRNGRIMGRRWWD